MRTGMIVHEGETGGSLLAFRVVLSRLGPDAVIPVGLLDDLYAHAGRRNHPRDVVGEFLAQSVNLATFHQRRSLCDHFGRDVIKHPPLVVLTPATPVAVLA